MKPLCLLSLSLALLAQTPPALPPDATPQPVRDLIRAAAEDLTNKDAGSFLDRFDGKMPGYQTLNLYVEALAARDEIISTIEIVTDQAVEHSDGQQRTLALDWTLNVDSAPLRRAVIKVTVEKTGKKWKFTSLDPVDFFKPPPL